MAAQQTNNVFSIRESGYDVGEVTAHIAALEARVARLEAEVLDDATATDLMSDVRFQALRLLSTARQDAETMVDEARREAAAIVDAAGEGGVADLPVPMLESHLEAIKAELPAPTQDAFVAVARRRDD